MVREDFSEFITHFTKDNGNSSGYDCMLSILYDQCLEARNPFGVARYKAPLVANQNAVCFSEVPLHCLSRIAERRSQYGIGFTKSFAKEKTSQPVWYVEKDSRQHQAIDELIFQGKGDATHPVWCLTPFIDVPGDYPSVTYRFEWEREWRCVGDFDFTSEDVAFLVIPEDNHEAARSFFEDAKQDNVGPFYNCPFIDSQWGLDKVESVIGGR